MIISFFVGINEANRGWKMILLLLAANVLSSLLVIVPIFLLVFCGSRGTDVAGEFSVAASRHRPDLSVGLWRQPRNDCGGQLDGRQTRRRLVYRCCQPS